MTTVTAVSFYDVVLWLHITGVVVGFGGTFAYGVIIATAARSHPRSMPGVMAGIAQNSRTLVAGGGTLILLSGIYLAADAWSFGDFFVSWGFVAIIVLMGMSGTVLRQNEVAAARAAERDVDQAQDGEVRFSAEFDAANRKLARFGAVAGVIIVVTIYVMSAKPFL